MSEQLPQDILANALIRPEEAESLPSLQAGFVLRT